MAVIPGPSGPPIIVIGMHRSGTSTVARVLDRLGVHMGRFCDENDEPKAYQRLNDWLLGQAGASWEHPLGIIGLIDNDRARSAAVTSMRVATDGPLLRMVHRGAGQGLTRWGWKDPRNTATLPLWLDVHPDATVVLVRRHGVPVAASLTRRSAEREHRIGKRHRLAGPLRPGPWTGCRTHTLDDAFAMWCDYVDLATAASRVTVTVDYERLVVDPVPVINELAKGLALVTSSDAVYAAAALVDRVDPYRFRSDPDLSALEQRHGEALTDRGYEPPLMVVEPEVVSDTR